MPDEHRRQKAARDFGALIQQHRRARMIRQEQLAEYVDKSARWMRDVEAGRASAGGSTRPFVPSASAANALFDRLGIQDPAKLGKLLKLWDAAEGVDRSKFGPEVTTVAINVQTNYPDPAEAAREFGALIRQCRRAMGIRQGELAEFLGKSDRWMRDVEAGRGSVATGGTRTFVPSGPLASALFDRLDIQSPGKLGRLIGLWDSANGLNLSQRSPEVLDAAFGRQRARSNPIRRARHKVETGLSGTQAALQIYRTEMAATVEALDELSRGVNAELHAFAETLCSSGTGVETRHSHVTPGFVAYASEGETQVEVPASVEHYRCWSWGNAETGFQIFQRINQSELSQQEQSVLANARVETRSGDVPKEARSLQVALEGHVLTDDFYTNPTTGIPTSRNRLFPSFEMSPDEPAVRMDSYFDTDMSVNPLAPQLRLLERVKSFPSIPSEAKPQREFRSRIESAAQTLENAHQSIWESSRTQPEAQIDLVHQAQARLDAFGTARDPGDIDPDDPDDDIDPGTIGGRNPKPLDTPDPTGGAAASRGPEDDVHIQSRPSIRTIDGEDFEILEPDSSSDPFDHYDVPSHEGALEPDPNLENTSADVPNPRTKFLDIGQTDTGHGISIF
jgi:ribosome-binding protein aMBF1 (putative translation factor)